MSLEKNLRRTSEKLAAMAKAVDACTEWHGNIRSIRREQCERTLNGTIRQGIEALQATTKNTLEELEFSLQQNRKLLQDAADRLIASKETIRHQEETIQEQREKMFDLEEQVSWRGQMEVDLRTELSDTKDKLQDANWELKRWKEEVAQERLWNGINMAAVEGAAAASRAGLEYE